MFARCLYDDMKMLKFPGRHCAKSDDLIKLCGPESNDGRKESIYYEENIFNKYQCRKNIHSIYSLSKDQDGKYPFYLLIISISTIRVR